MSVLESLFVGIFGMAVVFAVLVGLCLLARLQSSLFARFSGKKPAENLAGDNAAKASPAAEVRAPVALPSSGTEKAEPAAQRTQADGGDGRKAVGATAGGITASKLILTVNNKAFEVEIEEEPGPGLAAARSAAVTPRPQSGTDAPPAPPSAPVPAAPVNPAPPQPPVGGGSGVVAAPFPGTVLDIKAAAGAKVKRGDILLLMEAMKMENEIVAPRDGTVAEVLTTKGAAVVSGTPLVVLG